MTASRATITTTDDTIILQNRWIRRTFRTIEGFVSLRFDLRPWGAGTWLPTSSFAEHGYPMDAEATIDGDVLRVGPWKHGNLGHECQWSTVRHEVTEHENGIQADFVLKPRTGRHDVEMILHHFIAHDAPYMKRWVTVVNTGDTPVSIDSMIVEVMSRLRVGRQMWAYDAYIAPEVIDSPDFIGWKLHGYKLGPDVTLSPGDSFESHKVYTVVYDEGIEEKSAAINAMLRVEAPWCTRPPLRHQFGRVANWQDILETAKKSRKQGMEALVAFEGVHFFTQGCFDPNPKVFPNGEDDFKRLVDGLHEIDMKFFAYVGFCIASKWSDAKKNHPEWEMVGPEGRTYDPGGIGNMCPTSGWGDLLLEKCRWMVDDLGINGLQTDGPYYGQPCHATGHGHATPGEAQYRNWKFEMDFYREMQQRDVFVETPTGMFALLEGASSLPQGYYEEDVNDLAMFDLVTAFRGRLFTGQMRGLPGWAAWGFAMVDPYHGHGVWPPEENITEFEHLVAGHLGYGLSGFLHGWELTNGPASERILSRWTRFFSQFRETLAGDAVFLQIPTGLRPDAIMHVRTGCEVPAVVVAFNPLNEPVSSTWMLPLWRACLKGAVSVTPYDHDDKPITMKTDDVGNIILNAAFKPFEIRAWSIQPVS